MTVYEMAVIKLAQTAREMIDVNSLATFREFERAMMAGPSYGLPLEFFERALKEAYLEAFLR